MELQSQPEKQQQQLLKQRKLLKTFLMEDQVSLLSRLKFMRVDAVKGKPKKVAQRASSSVDPLRRQLPRLNHFWVMYL
jgi:hypothetical protein